MAETINDKDLIISLARGDSETFKRLYKTYYYMVKNFVEKNNGSPDEASDIFQDTLIALYEKCRDEKLQLTSSIKTYIYSIARNQWLKKLRDKKGHVRLNEFESFIPVEDDSNEDPDTDLLNRLLGEIGESCRQLLILFYYRKQNMENICKQLGYSNADTAKTQKYKCLQRMKKMIAKQ